MDTRFRSKVPFLVCAIVWLLSSRWSHGIEGVLCPCRLGDGVIAEQQREETIMGMIQTGLPAPRNVLSCMRDTGVEQVVLYAAWDPRVD